MIAGRAPLGNRAARQAREVPGNLGTFVPGVCGGPGAAGPGTVLPVTDLETTLTKDVRGAAVAGGVSDGVLARTRLPGM